MCGLAVVVEDMPDVMLSRMEWTRNRNIPLRHHVEIENGIQMCLFYSFDDMILSPRIRTIIEYLMNALVYVDIVQGIH